MFQRLGQQQRRHVITSTTRKTRAVTARSTATTVFRWTSKLHQRHEFSLRLIASQWTRGSISGSSIIDNKIKYNATATATTRSNLLIKNTNINQTFEKTNLNPIIRFPTTSTRSFSTPLPSSSSSSSIGGEKTETTEKTTEETETTTAIATAKTITKTTEQKRQRRRHFDELNIHPILLNALKKRKDGLNELTEIQDKTYDIILAGSDVVGRARTGTGKTLSYLLPALERIIRNTNVPQQSQQRSGNIKLLILSPTRELAIQIGQEVKQLLSQQYENYYDNDTTMRMISSQVIYGGFPKQEDINTFNKQIPTILIATPGRLKDHLVSTKLMDGRRPFIDTVQNLQTLVLDETDRLLDLGFRQDVQDILACIPKKRQRQTLLFSATIPSKVREVIELATKPDYQVVDCINEEDPATHTNVQTQQSHIILPSERFWTGTMEILLEQMRERSKSQSKKIIVFFPMNSMVQFYYNLFALRFGRQRIWSLHGKMDQRERTTTSRRFRNATDGYLFTSDVSARGVDYPNVTHVIQVGAADSRESYIHRLGRTGRAGKDGQGLLILPEIEQDFVLNELDGLDVPLDLGLGSRLALSRPSKQFMDELGPIVQNIRLGNDERIEQSVKDVYHAMVSYYFQRCHKSLHDDVTSTINNLIHVMGLIELPAISSSRVKKFGIDDDTIVGLNVRENWKDKEENSDTGSWGGSYGNSFGKNPKRYDLDDNRRGPTSSGRRRSQSVDSTARNRNRRHQRQQRTFDRSTNSFNVGGEGRSGQQRGRGRDNVDDTSVMRGRRRGRNSYGRVEQLVHLGWEDNASRMDDDNTKNKTTFSSHGKSRKSSKGSNGNSRKSFQRWEVRGEWTPKT